MLIKRFNVANATVQTLLGRFLCFSLRVKGARLLPAVVAAADARAAPALRAAVTKSPAVPYTNNDE
jgi:hypothetical protein